MTGPTGMAVLTRMPIAWTVVSPISGESTGTCSVGYSPSTVLGPCGGFTLSRSECSVRIMTTEADNGAVPADGAESASGIDMIVWFGWMASFGIVGTLVSIAVQIPGRD